MQALRRIATVLLLAVLGLAAFSSPAIGQITYTLDYSDPASDVVKLWTSNLTWVLADGAWIRTPFPDAVNINFLHSSLLDPQTLELRIDLKGAAVANNSDVSYSINLYTDATNRTRYTVTGSNGTLTIVTNLTGAVPIDISGPQNFTLVGANQDTVVFRVALSLLGSVTSFNIDATARWYGYPADNRTYSYQDFGWETPGNPASAPVTVSGYVRDREGNPIIGARITNDRSPTNASTNATGYYLLVLTPDVYNLTASAEGYEDATERVVLAGGTLIELNFTLEPKGLPVLGAAGGLVAAILLIAVAAAVVLLVAALLRRRKAA